MSRKACISIIFVFPILYLAGCALLQRADKYDTQPSIVEREFRAAWVATVANINWPSERGISVEEQKKEAVFLLDLLADHNFNAVIFQVRPQCDALYKSDLEPWSYYLTGAQGKAPDPFYDPLEFWISEAHKRGLELHVWLNPYRAHHTAGGPVTEHSIVRRKPDLVVELANGYWWLDPGKKGTQDHSTAVVMDIVKRYDIDGVHFDDYFYPYPSYNNNEEFPDDKTYQSYVREGGRLSRDDWRRENVNTFIARIYKSIKKEKPHVKFGLSPFGIWRPNYPSSIAGFDQYDQLFADARLWLNKGWIDYFTPQLYWPVNQYSQSFPVLLGWWASENLEDRHLWPGMNIGRIKPDKLSDEVINQIMISRGILKDDPGQVHWSIGPLVDNPSLLISLKEGPYRKQALIPSSPWLDHKKPDPPLPEYTIADDSIHITWKQTNSDDISQWVVYFNYGPAQNYNIVPSAKHSQSIPLWKFDPGLLLDKSLPGFEDVQSSFRSLKQLSLSAVDRSGNESDLVRLPDTELNGLERPNASTINFILADLKENTEEENGDESSFMLGVEVLLDTHLNLLRGKRTGLITNPSAVDRNLKSTVDLLAAHPDINLVALFGPEHGIRGARQGRIFKEGTPDPATGIPVYSLYGDTYSPKKEWLDRIDIMVFDIQGAGSAWYTFKYSMSFAMEACAEAGIPFVVLDRPNPLGGSIVEGPLLDLGGIFRHKLPLRHGMTYGELASMWNTLEDINADLHVIKMKGWKRETMWNDTDLFWVMPSPNMGTFKTAVVYPGQCLFERSNISEARGTTKPFLMSGAPWIDGQKASRDLNSRDIPGVVFRPAFFIPENFSTSDNPREKPWNELCSGVEIMIKDPEIYRSVETTLHILDAYMKTSPGKIIWDPPEPIKQLEHDNTTVDDVIKDCQEEIRDFIKTRDKFLLYE